MMRFYATKIRQYEDIGICQTAYTNDIENDMEHPAGARELRQSLKKFNHMMLIFI